MEVYLGKYAGQPRESVRAMKVSTVRMFVMRTSHLIMRERNA